ncbi:MAG TPA: CBS domain-containing protein [Candidatus Dormibacteraeota bacterium]|nr:CBS domain-containing protein [Candidatus Dormibacteraeota bacterium]
MQVSLWMKEKPYCVTAEDRLDDVAKAMADGGFRHAPVVDAEGHVIGMVSDRDMREHKGFLPTTGVSAAMIEPAVTVGPDDPIERAALLMREHKIGALPVVDAQRHLIGILTETDLLDGLLDGIGVGEHAARIDFTFSSPQQNFSQVAQAVERAGGTVLGLGTFQSTGDGSGARRFFVRFTAPRIDTVVDALGHCDLLIDDVQHLKVRSA